MSYKLRPRARRVNVTAVIRKWVTEALYKSQKTLVLTAPGEGGREALL